MRACLAVERDAHGGGVREARVPAVRVRARDDAGAKTRIVLRAFAPWKKGRAWGFPEPVLPVLVFVVLVAGVAVLAAFQGPWVVAVLLFSPMATTWLGVVIGLVLWLIAAWPRHLSRSRAAALFGAKRCPSCDYSLRETRASERRDREGRPLTICPECGAAWCVDEPGETRRYKVTVGKALGGSTTVSDGGKGEQTPQLDPVPDAG